MTPDAELEALVAEQERDDTHRVDLHGGQVSLDANAYGRHDSGSIGAENVGRDPWDLVDDVIDLGLDPTEVAYAGDMVVALPRRRGLLLFGDGLVDSKRIPHATAGGYQNHRCRCIPCTAAWATYARERRAARKAASSS